MSDADDGSAGAGHGPFPKLVLGALGVVYGDIGTSPLYAVRECFAGAHRQMAVTPERVLGVMSLFVWAFLLVVVLKYLVFVMKADNQGEGGILALLALAVPRDAKQRSTLAIGAGLLGAALLYSDGTLTPAISVLSAVEGIGVVTHELESFVVPVSCAIIIGLFAVQRFGTATVGSVFGPVMAVWFLTLATAGVPWILEQPEVLWAINPMYAVALIEEQGFQTVWLLGSVVLCVTGAEALYADMGHFGRKPIQTAWYAMVFPALLLNYLGQGALLLTDPSAASQPFYSLVPRTLLIPLVVIATAATIIASQALISGAFSLTQQAIQLGYLPRMLIIHTSRVARGQIYLPAINWMLMFVCLAFVIGFRTSAHLADAYGMAVTGTMTITTLLYFQIAKRTMGGLAATLICGLFLAFDIPFVVANLLKLVSGAWVPLVLGMAMFTVMSTWKRGRELLGAYIGTHMSRPLDDFLTELRVKPVTRVPGTAVFMTSATTGTPAVLLYHLKHIPVLHEQVILLSVEVLPQPFVSFYDRVAVTSRGEGFWRVVARYGFMQTPRIAELLKACEGRGLMADMEHTSFYLGRERLLLHSNRGMSRWRKSLFGFLSRNSRTAADFFKIPATRAMEIGLVVEL